jgi:L,D-peptidoglycan transpeptidase YkuD (ErfK/YbiS/YcfS/YnhG family)
VLRVIRRLLPLLLLVLLAAPADAATPPVLGHLGSATRALIVTGPTASSTTGTATAWQKVNGTWHVARGSMPVHLGRNGFRSASSRHEGDGTTPAGKFHLRYAFGSAPNPGSRIGWKAVVPQSCWSGERADYNRWAHRACTSRDEDLYASRRTAYRYVVAVGFNDNPAVYGRGSAIFLHQSSTRPTSTTWCGGSRPTPGS